jgi:NAD(P)-dependent dehydrogenase (short-subunit alcohol dehydrogenase family)
VTRSAIVTGAAGGIVVNNAGIDVIAPFLETDEDDWDRIIAVNLKGLFHG